MIPRFLLLLLFIILSSSMFAPRRQRMMQSIKINDLIFEAPTFEKITFDEFKDSLNKRYRNPSQEMYRMLVFNQNSKIIQSHNIAVEQTIQKKQPTYTMEINQFSDLTEKQFRQIYTKTYPTSQVVVEKTQQVIKAAQTRSILCKDCRQPTNDPSIVDPTQQIPSALDLEILRIVQESQLQKEQSTTELDALLDKLKKDMENFAASIDMNMPTVSIPEDFPKIDLNNIFNSNTKKPTIDIPMPMDKSRLLQTTNQTQSVEIDWTTSSGAIKYQGVCGSCYAFATADAVSAMYAIYKFGFNVALSVQQIVDCPQNGLTYGCGGGFLEGAYAYIQTNGITTNFQYKYTGKAETCKTNNGTFKIKEFKTLPQGDCNILINELKRKPIAVGIAGYRLKFYSSGVFDDCNEYIDHAVLLVGYKSGLGWKIKNTWGTTWGMNGYAWLKEGNTCGMCMNAVSATIAEEPAPQEAGKAAGGAAVRPNIDQKLGAVEVKPQQLPAQKQTTKAKVDLDVPPVILQSVTQKQTTTSSSQSVIKSVETKANNSK